MVAETLAAAERLLPHVVDGVAYINERSSAASDILAEGAQGTLLDVGYGTYPYVTSSHTSPAARARASASGPGAIRSVTGIVKAYCTRVGGGPFPSELADDEAGERCARPAASSASVTGRPRRCGWFDAVAGSVRGASQRSRPADRHEARRLSAASTGSES